jgi:FHA domain-containing protein
LVLPDTTRTISRKHAIITFNNGVYYIENKGSSIPLYLNGRSLGNGTAILANDDEIRIGGYAMKVRMQNPAAQIVKVSKDTPELFPSGTDNDPFGGLLTSTPSSAEKTPIIPPDFNPFVKVPPEWPPPVDSPQHTADPLDFSTAEAGPSIASERIEDICGLELENGADPLAPGSPFAEQAHQPGYEPVVTARGRSGTRLVEGEARRSDLPELQTHMPARTPVSAPDVAVTQPSASEESSSSSSEPHDISFSWDNEHPLRVVIPSPVHENEKPGGYGNNHPVVASTQTAPPRVSERVADDRHPQDPGKKSVGKDASLEAESIAGADPLLHSFLEGAGVSDLAIPGGLTPEFMNMIGRLLRESTQATLDLLLARTLVKREVHASVTVIAPGKNNPLKFSPSVEAALVHLLAPRGHGFMSPLEAMRNATNDLRSHQFGVIAGMRAALAGVLERFSPDQLERRLTHQKSVIDSLLPVNRKAKLWDLFTEHYKEISAESEEDFHVLFGKEFVRAYEEQIAKLEKDDKEITG